MNTVSINVMGKATKSTCKKTGLFYGMAYFIDHSPATIQIYKRYEIVEVNGEPDEALRVYFKSVVLPEGCEKLEEIPEGSKVLAEIYFTNGEPRQLDELDEMDRFEWNPNGLELTIDLESAVDYI